MHALEAGVPFGPILEAHKLNRAHVRAYRLENPAADKEWSVAREAGADAYADQINLIASNADMEPNTARVRIQALQWLAARRNPREYSDKTQIDMNIKHVDLAGIIAAANARLALARPAQAIPDGRVIEGEVIEALPAELL